jgi:osmotically-inducible protein OsmY
MRKVALKKSRLATLVLALTAVILLLAACSSTRTTGEQVDDGWITTKIKAKLTGDGDINPFNIDVDVLEGVVTLTGKVKKPEAKVEAERHARNTKGVKQVINDIEVEPAA